MVGRRDGAEIGWWEDSMVGRRVTAPLPPLLHPVLSKGGTLSNKGEGILLSTKACFYVHFLCTQLKTGSNNNIYNTLNRGGGENGKSK